jgi:zinc transport system substrate-binding protein
MKKKLLFSSIIVILLLLTTGCINNDKLEGAEITTTVYPIEYLVSRLYNNDTTIKSIYPNDVNVSTYELTDKQIKDYSKNTTLFIYNGLTNEKEIAKTLINKNKHIQILDVSYGLSYKYGIEELWLNPNKYLMLANTLKNDLKDLSASKYAAEEIEKKYALLEEDLTTLDAELRNISESSAKAKKNTIVIAYNSLGFLESYGFNVINISNETSITASIKNKFKNKEYTYILVDDKDNISDTVKDFVDNYGTELIEINTLNTITDDQRNSQENYLTIMNTFINTLSNKVL